MYWSLLTCKKNRSFSNSILFIYTDCILNKYIELLMKKNSTSWIQVEDKRELKNGIMKKRFLRVYITLHKINMYIIFRFETWKHLWLKSLVIYV